LREKAMILKDPDIYGAKNNYITESLTNKKSIPNSRYP